MSQHLWSHFAVRKTVVQLMWKTQSSEFVLIYAIKMYLTRYPIIAASSRQFYKFLQLHFSKTFCETPEAPVFSFLKPVGFLSFAAKQGHKRCWPPFKIKLPWASRIPNETNNPIAAAAAQACDWRFLNCKKLKISTRHSEHWGWATCFHFNSWLSFSDIFC